ncbi:MAG TPA: polysaccharide biosynthesis tyrosine autokinase [Acetobacteraceae bacterium]|nr:polysaccharide biosynthesis tyrosine autokinase [Acetobacteraceae bacterium]
MLDRPAGPSTALPVPIRGRSGPEPPEPAGNDPISPRLVLAALRRRRLTLILNLLLWPLLGFIAIEQITPRYTAVGTLIYEPSEYKLRELQSILQSDPTTDSVMASQAEIVRGLRVVEEVVKRGNLYNNPEFDVALRPHGWLRRGFDAVVSRLRHRLPQRSRALPGPAQDSSRNATLMAVQAAFDVRTVKFSRVLEIDFTAEDPQVAATAVNNAMDAYIRNQFAAKHRAVDHATAFLNDRAAELRKDVRSGEDRIAAYRAKAGLTQGMHAGMDAEEISHLGEDLVHARSALGEAEAKLDAASGRVGAAAQAAIAPSVVQLRAAQDQISAQIQAEQGRLGPNHPEAIALRRQYADAQRAVAAETARVVAATAEDVRAARERVEALEQDLEKGQAAEDRSAQAQVALNAMQRDVEASRQELQAVLDRIQQTAQQAELESAEAHEISLALPPDTPSFPRPVPLMAAVTAFGLGFGLLMAYLLELADDTLRSGEAVRAALGLPCFALLPELSRRELGRLSADEYVARHTLSLFAEQVRALRAGLRIGRDHPHVIAVTAARTGEGKTTVALALARSAALSGEHVLLMECDLRRPTFAARLRVGPTIGLAECLRQGLPPHQAIVTDLATRMDVMQAGRVGVDLPDRFLSHTIASILFELRQEYDLILLDCPPLQAIAEARILAGVADATLLCARWGGTRRPAAQHTLALLEEAHAHVVGCVLTRVDAAAHVRSGYADADVYHRRRYKTQG